MMSATSARSAIALTVCATLFLSAVALAKTPNKHNAIAERVDTLEAEASEMAEARAAAAAEFGVDSFFDIFVELRTTTELGEAVADNVSEILALFDAIVSARAGGGADSFFDIFIEDDLRIANLEDEVGTIKSVFSAIAKAGGVDSFFDIFIEDDLRTSAIEKQQAAQQAQLNALQAQIDELKAAQANCTCAK